MHGTDLKSLDTQLNDMAKQGKMLEVLEKFYDENCTFQEGNQAAPGSSSPRASPARSVLRNLTGDQRPRLASVR